jgi:hypothetical protein
MSVKSLARTLDEKGIVYGVAQPGRNPKRNVGVVAVANVLDTSALRNRVRPPRNSHQRPDLRINAQLLPQAAVVPQQTATQGSKFSTTCLAISVVVMSVAASLGIWYMNAQLQQNQQK